MARGVNATPVVANGPALSEVERSMPLAPWNWRPRSSLMDAIRLNVNMGLAIACHLFQLHPSTLRSRQQ